MKSTLIWLPALILAFTFTSCKKCKGEDPISRIVNNGTEVASVHIETSGGNTININNIYPGTISDDRSFAPGNVEFTVSIGSGTASDFVLSVPMEECWEYEIVIDENNNVSSVPKDRNE